MFTTRNGSPREPEYLNAIDDSRCIGRGRCYKVRSRDVMHLRGVDDDGNLVPCAMDEDDDDEEFVRKVMVVDGAGKCIGCGACVRVGPKSCQTHVKASQLAAAA